MRFYILCASLTNQINAGYSPCPSLFVVGTFIARSYTSVAAFAKYLEILLMASFELCIAAYQYGGGWVVYFNPYCDCFDVVCNEEYGFIYTYQSCYRNLCFPKDQISTIKQNTVYTQKKGEANQRSIFHSQTTVLSLSLSSFHPRIQTLCTESYRLSPRCMQGNSRGTTTHCCRSHGWLAQRQ